MVLVSGEATILGLSVVEVSGAATIRDDISMTARRTTLAKTFQTKLFRRNGESHAPAQSNICKTGQPSSKLKPKMRMAER